MDTSAIIANIAIMLLPLVFAITLHEAAHGYIASKLGDQTARMLGRVTLNPIKHIDPIGTVILPIAMMVLTHFNFLFGWAKPVPVTWRNLRNPRRDMALVAFAGPFSNFIMALSWALIAKITLMLQASLPFISATVSLFFLKAGLYGIMINAVLLILNLIPIPPLDGSRVLSALLPPSLALSYSRIEPYGIWIVLGFIYILGPSVLFPPVRALTSLIVHWFALPL